MNRKVLLVAASAVALAACDGFKEAMTAHVDVVARAGSQELSVERLAELLAASKVPLRRDVAKAVAELWVDYQLLARAAARGDSLNDPKLVEAAMWAEIENTRARKWYETVSTTWGSDTATEAAYNQGELLAARHILFGAPEQGLSTAKRDSIRRAAEAVRARVTPANFARLAQQHSQDPGSKERGGYLGVFPKGMMVPEFEQALAALKPGEISPVVRSQFGYHIIQRLPYADAKEDFAKMHAEHFSQMAEQRYIEALEKSGNVQVRDNAPATVKAVAQDADAHLNDRTVIATSAAGEFTAARLARWVKAFPPQAQVRQQLVSAPDTLIPHFVRKLVVNELVLKQADSAGVRLDSAEMQQVASTFAASVLMSWRQLGIAPEMLADSAATPEERERLASRRVDEYMTQLLAERARFVEIPEPLSTALEQKYDAKVNEAGLDRAVERATRVRAALDSTRAGTPQQQPQGMPQQGQPGMQQQPRPPQPQGSRPPGARPPGAQPPAGQPRAPLTP